MSPPLLPADDSADNFDWEQWPSERARMVESVKALKQQLESLDRPELDALRRASQKFLADIQNVITAGDAEYSRLHPGAQFEPS
jgi:hypothetical protein